MSNIPTVNYSAKFILEQELSLGNCPNSLSLMPLVLLLIIHLIAYQQLHDKGPCFFNSTVVTFTYVNTPSPDKI